MTIRLEKPATKEKPDSEFIIKVRNFLKDSDIEILEEVEKKKKDFIAKVRVSSDVGKIEFICIAKEKKKITENDLAISMQKASSEKSPILLLSTGEPDKKAEQSLKSINLVKFKRI
ncbi:hypothetical protein COV15_00700 [Candidatus Woesearchaeota archaeon CG10_big_fil_rev_8_21_14_0_10_34_12]|nr:MAG: hypothetical protein COV15_00700 [Candidatus Woesearchaeota archaeon CG10_big_fil_rev_8_21_14_0_10_34_12]